jgi:hypothetical protein
VVSARGEVVHTVDSAMGRLYAGSSGVSRNGGCNSRARDKFLRIALGRPRTFSGRLVRRAGFLRTSGGVRAPWCLPSTSASRQPGWHALRRQGRQVRHRGPAVGVIFGAARLLCLQIRYVPFPRGKRKRRLSHASRPSRGVLVRARCDR